MKVVSRIRRWYGKDAVEKATEASHARDAGERDQIEEEAEGVMMDRFLMAGNGSVVPLLPIGSAEELTEIFEYDEHAPDDEAS